MTCEAIIDSNARSLGISLQVLTMEDRDKLASKILNLLKVNISKEFPWDAEDAPQGRFFQDGWALIPSYVGNRSCFFFLKEAKKVWRINSGDDLLSLLSECPVLEYYACDEDSTFLLCSNHHDYLVGWGAAQIWVDNL